MALIALLSGDIGGHSHLVRFVAAVVSAWCPGLEDCAATEGRLETILLYLRKPAHVVLYGVLAVLSYNFLLRTTQVSVPLRYGLALMWCGVFGVLDETHQAMTGTRTPSGLDVGLDVLAAATALLLVRLREKARAQRRPVPQARRSQ